MLGIMWGINKMQNIKIKNFIYLLVGFSGLIWFILACLSKLDLSVAKDFFSLAPKVISIDLIVIGVFVKWGWKFKVFRSWLVPFPNVNGTWLGNIRSDWIDPKTGERVPLIPVMLTIKQSFNKLNCVMHTTEMKSTSISEGFNINIDKQVKQLSYIYTSKPRITLNKRSVPHDGAIVFDIIETPSKKMKGRYWTERNTTGEIILTYKSKVIFEEMPEETPEHPVTESENR